MDEFREWVQSDKCRSRGCSDLWNQSRAPYIPLPELQQYFRDESRVLRIFDSLFYGDYEKDLPIKALPRYLRVFSILLLIGKGRFIRQFVRYDSLSDGKLPFENPPPDFPLSTDQDMLQVFQDRQWLFCALDLDYDCDRILTSQYILPIIPQQRIGKCTKIIKQCVTVDAAYNKLTPFNGDTMVGRSNSMIYRAH